MVWGSNSGGNRIFHTYPDNPQNTPILLCSECHFSIRSKDTKALVWLPTPFWPQCQRVELHLYHPSVCSWYVVGWNLLLHFYVLIHENDWSRIYHVVGKGVSVIQCAEMTERSLIVGAGDYIWHSPLSAFFFIPLWLKALTAVQ